GRALERLQAHADNSPLGMVELDPDLCLRSWSKGAERMFGWTQDEMAGRALSDLGWLPEEDDGFLSALAQAMTDQRHMRGLDAVRLRRKDGSTADCEWYGSVLRDDSARPISLNVQILDVTERRRAAETQRLLIGE